MTLPISSQQAESASLPPVAPQRALFLIHNLRMGGAERTLVTYVNHARIFQPTVIVVEREIELLPELDSSVRLFDLSTPRHRSEIARIPPLPPSNPTAATLLHQARQVIPDANLATLLWKAHRLSRLAEESGSTLISSFLNKSHTIALFAKLFFNPRLRVVINGHELLSQHVDHFFSPPGRVMMRWFVRTLFPRADRFVAVAEGVRRDLIQNFAIPAERIVVVHNPLDLERIRRQAREAAAPAGYDSATGPLVVAVGRLVRLKGFDLLLRAFAELPAPLGARLAIIGEGEERPALQRLIRELGLTGRAVLLGKQENPWRYMAQADVVVLSSLTEAFPNVIGEALALGRAVLATECSPGIREFLDGSTCGLLVPPGDAAALAAGLERLLTDPELRLQLGQRGRRRAEDFDLLPAVKRYETALRGACGPVL